MKAYYLEELKDKPNFTKAQEYEKLFWQNPDSGLEERVITCYTSAGAFSSAKRFYYQMRKLVDLGVGFSNQTAPQLWVLGFMEGDEELMKTVLKDSNTGSYTAMLTHMYHAAAHDDSKGMESAIDFLIERYDSRKGPKSTARVLKEFVPLIPAIKDPKHPDRDKALDFLGKSEVGAVLRWILIRKYKLNTTDAIRLLGGRETDLFRHVLIEYMENDAEGVKSGFVELSKNGYSDSRWGIAVWLTAQLHKPSIPEDQDLKPTGATSIRQAMLEKLRQSK